MSCLKDMKNLLKKSLLFCLLMSLSFGGFAQSWTGAVSTAWNNAGNWDAGGVPTASSSPYIGSCTTCPQLNGHTTVASITVEGGKLNIGANTLNVNGVFAMNGGELTANNGVVNANRVGAFVYSTFNGIWTLKINSAGTNNYLGAMGGGNTFNNDFVLEANTGDWTTFSVANSFGDIYKGKTTLKNTGQGWLMIASNSSSNTVFQQDVDFINANATEGKIQIGVYGGKIQCNKKAQLIDNTDSPFSYIDVSEALFADEVMIETKKAAITIGQQGTTTFKKKLSVSNSGNARIALGSAGGGVVFEKEADVVFLMAMKKGQLLLQQFDFQGDNATPPLNLVLSATEPDIDRPNTLIRLGYWGTFNRVVNVEADYIQYNLITFKKQTNLKRTGITSAVPNGFIGYGLCPGSSVFEDNITFNNNYGDDWILGAYNADVFKKNANFIHGNNAYGALRPSYSGNTTYEGNIEISMPNAGANGIVWGENGGTSTLVAGKTLSVGSFGNGWMGLANFTQLGTGTAHNLNFGAMSLWFNNCQFQSPLTLSAARLTLSNSTFFDSFFTKTGNGIDNSLGVNVFKKKIRFKNQAPNGEIRFINQNSTVINP